MPKQPLTECHVIHTAVQLERRLIPAINPPPRTSSSQQCATSTAPERYSRRTKVCSQHVTAARRQRRIEVYRSLTNTTRLDCTQSRQHIDFPVQRNVARAAHSLPRRLSSALACRPLDLYALYQANQTLKPLEADKASLQRGRDNGYNETRSLDCYRHHTHTRLLNLV